MFIRYFALVDGSDLSSVAASYCSELVDTGVAVRLVSTRLADLREDDDRSLTTRENAGTANLWRQHSGLLSTPMTGGFMNVVCGHTDDWARYWTSGVTNILLVTPQNVRGDAPQPSVITAVSKYDLVFARDNETAAAFAARFDRMPLCNLRASIGFAQA